MNDWRKYLNFTTSINQKLLLWFSGALFFLALFIKLTAELLEDSKIQTLDDIALSFVGNHLRLPALNGIAVDITALGSPSLVAIITIISIIALALLKDRIGIIYLLLNVIGGTLWTSLIKNLVARPRPQVITHLVEVTGQSYPSGHTTLATITYFSIALLINQHVKSIKVISLSFAMAATLSILTALTRLYLGVHYPSDVISGIFFGVSWVLFLTAFFKSFAKN